MHSKDEIRIMKLYTYLYVGGYSSTTISNTMCVLCNSGEMLVNFVFFCISRNVRMYPITFKCVLVLSTNNLN